MLAQTMLMSLAVATFPGKRLFPGNAKVSTAALVALLSVPPLNVAADTRWVSPWHDRFERVLEPHFDKTLFDEFVHKVRMDEEQQSIAEALFTEYLDAYNVFRATHEEEVGLAEFRESVRSLTRKTGAELIDALKPLAEREEQIAPIADEQAQLEIAFLQDIQAILRDGQHAHFRWALYWRHRQTLMQGSHWYPGDSVTIFDILEHIEVSDANLLISQAEYQELLSSVAESIDAALVARRDILIRDARETFRFELRRRKANLPLYVYDDHGRHIDTVSPDPEFQHEAARRWQERNDAVRRVHEVMEGSRARLKDAIVPELRPMVEEVWFELATKAPPPRAERFIQDLIDSDNDSQRQQSLQMILGECLRKHRESVRRCFEMQVETASLRYSQKKIPGATDPTLLRMLELQDMEMSESGDRIRLDDRAMQQAWELFLPDEQAEREPPPYWW